MNDRIHPLPIFSNDATPLGPEKTEFYSNETVVKLPLAANLVALISKNELPCH